MYLKGSNWSMTRRRRRPNWLLIIFLSLLVLGGAYFNRYVMIDIQPLGVPTSTPTRPPESFVTEAQELFKQGKLLQAIAAYQQAIAARPDDSNTYVELARIQVWAGQYADAQESAENALLLNNNNAMAHAVRAWSLDFQEKYLEAEAAIKTARDLDPNNGLIHAYYAEILIDSYLAGTGPIDSLDLAIEESNVTLALAPDTIEAHRARGYVLENTQNYQLAIEQYQAAIAINGNIADLHLAVGRNYRALGINDLAVEEFSLADSLNPNDPNPDLFISRTYANIGEYGKAAQYAETAVRDNPNDATLRANLGVMYYNNARWSDAAEQLSLVVNGGQSPEGTTIESIELVPDNARLAGYYFTYGMALARTNRCGEALKIAQLLQDRVPTNEDAMINAVRMVEICRENMNATPTPPLSLTLEPDSATATPAATETPTPEATP
jgi:tetratricopeptide (TPR) repeat protein